MSARPSQGFENLALSESGFLFDAKSGLTYSLNPTGTFLLRQLIDGASDEALVGRLHDTFEVDERTAKQDLEQFILRLRDLGLL
jgi:PqqD family protein of HPr-rel-A system